MTEDDLSQLFTKYPDADGVVLNINQFSDILNWSKLASGSVEIQSQREFLQRGLYGHFKVDGSSKRLFVSRHMDPGLYVPVKEQFANDFMSGKFRNGGLISEWVSYHEEYDWDEILKIINMNEALK